jgi:hypothetical protein
MTYIIVRIYAPSSEVIFSVGEGRAAEATVEVAEAETQPR